MNKKYRHLKQIFHIQKFHMYSEEPWSTMSGRKRYVARNLKQYFAVLFTLHSWDFNTALSSAIVDNFTLFDICRHKINVEIVKNF
jgi:hypothetical protein